MVSSLQAELDRFFQILSDTTISIRTVSKSAFCQARQKIRGNAFRYLNFKMIRFFYDHHPIQKWRGFRLLAIDGTTSKLPQTDEIANHFTLWKNRRKKPQALVRISILYDILNKLVVDAIAAPKRFGEKTLIIDHFDDLKKGDLLIMDAGYPSAWLFKYLIQKGIHYCIRMQSKSPWWLCLREFKASDQHDVTISLALSQASQKRCRQLGLSMDPVTIRLVKVILPSGECEILATSFLDADTISIAELSKLYQLRWSIEETIKELKYRMEIPNFSGKKVEVIYQDIYSKIVIDNLVSIFGLASQRIVDQMYAHRHYRYAINRTQAIRKLKDTIIRILFADTPSITTLILFLIQRFADDTEPIRPNRQFERHSFLTRPFHMGYKPL